MQYLKIALTIIYKIIDIFKTRLNKYTKLNINKKELILLKISPSNNKFIELASEYNLIPVYTELRGDLHTTVSLFTRLKKEKYQFLLESAVSGEYFGRYSFMGSSDKAFVCRDGQVSFVVIKDDGRREIEVELPNRYRISPQVASAMKTAKGIVDVELV